MSSHQSTPPSQMSTQLQQLLPSQATTAIVLMTTTTTTPAKSANSYSNDDTVNNNSVGNVNNNGLVCDILAKATETIFSSPPTTTTQTLLFTTSDTSRLLLPPKLEPMYTTGNQMAYASQLSASKNDIQAILLVPEERHAPTLHPIQPILELPSVVDSLPPVLSLPSKLESNDGNGATNSQPIVGPAIASPANSNLSAIQSCQQSVQQSIKQSIVPLLISIPPKASTLQTASKPAVADESLRQTDELNNNNNNNINDNNDKNKTVDNDKCSQLNTSNETNIKTKTETESEQEEQTISSLGDSLTVTAEALPKSCSESSPRESIIPNASSNAAPLSSESKPESSQLSSSMSNANSTPSEVNTIIQSIFTSPSTQQKPVKTTPTFNAENSILSSRLRATPQKTTTASATTTTTTTSSPKASQLSVARKGAAKASSLSPQSQSTATVNKKQSPTTAAAKLSQLNSKSSLVCATKSMPTPVLAANYLAAQQKLKPVTDNSSPVIAGDRVETSTKKRRHSDIVNDSVEKFGENDSIDEESASTRVSKRVRLQYQPFQSPEAIQSLMPYKFRSTVTAPKSSVKADDGGGDSKVVIYSRGEFLAVRNETTNNFFVCRTYQNVYKNSRKFKIQWWTNENKSLQTAEHEVYVPDFFDRLDFECVLTNLTMTRLNKDQYGMTAHERQRSMNILQRAINLEKGITESPNLSQIANDGIDVSIVGKEEEKELLKKINSRQRYSAKKDINLIKKKYQTKKKPKIVKTKGKSKIKNSIDNSKLTKAALKKPVIKREAFSSVGVKSLRLKQKQATTRGETKISPITITAINSRSKSTKSTPSIIDKVNRVVGRPASSKMTIMPVFSTNSLSGRPLRTAPNVNSKKLGKSVAKSANNRTTVASPEIKSTKNKILIDMSPKSRLSKRVRQPYQPFQSVEAFTPNDTNSRVLNSQQLKTRNSTKQAKLITSKKEKPEVDEVEPVIYNRGEFLAVRNEANEFFICRTFENIYKHSRHFKIQWFSDDRSPSIYTADFYDHIDFETILTNLTMNRLDKGQYSLPNDERQRTMNILQKAINVEKGIVLPQSCSKVTADGVDVSVVGRPEEKQFKKISTKNVAKQDRRANNIKISLDTKPVLPKNQLPIVTKKLKANQKSKNVLKATAKQVNQTKASQPSSSATRRSTRTASSPPSNQTSINKSLKVQPKFDSKSKKDLRIRISPKAGKSAAIIAYDSTLQTKRTASLPPKQSDKELKPAAAKKLKTSKKSTVSSSPSLTPLPAAPIAAPLKRTSVPKATPAARKKKKRETPANRLRANKNQLISAAPAVNNVDDSDVTRISIHTTIVETTTTTVITAGSPGDHFSDFNSSIDLISDSKAVADIVDLANQPTIDLDAVVTDDETPSVTNEIGDRSGKDNDDEEDEDDRCGGNGVSAADDLNQSLYI